MMGKLEILLLSGRYIEFYVERHIGGALFLSLRNIGRLSAFSSLLGLSDLRPADRGREQTSRIISIPSGL